MKPIPKPKKSKKLTVTKVQDAVNAAIRRRDGRCMVRDHRHECAGVLTASHFFAVGGNSCLRFYPFNIFGQCFGHHGIHERKHDPVFYHNFMLANYPEELEWMERNQGKSIKYSQPVLEKIRDYAISDDLDGLRDYIRELFKEYTDDAE